MCTRSPSVSDKRRIAHASPTHRPRVVHALCTHAYLRSSVHRRPVHTIGRPAHHHRPSCAPPFPVLRVPTAAAAHLLKPRSFARADVCRGSRICLQLAYPYGWCAFYRKTDDDASGRFEWEPILTGKEVRPTFQEVEAALIDADVPFKFTEFDLNSIV